MTQPGRSLGGRFSEATDPLLEQVNRSVDVDKRLWDQDIRGSRAHARMLAATGILPEGDVAEILRGLDAVHAELAAGAFTFLPSDEDIHMAVERRLTEIIGEPARRLHTGRSRNDQVMTDALLWTREAFGALATALGDLARTFADRAVDGVDVPMPSFTHSQPAQTSSVAHWLLAHAWEIQRHQRRVIDFIKRLDECPLGAGASAGGHLPLDRGMTARELGFARPAPNSVAATGSRADLLDGLHLLSLVGTSISRLGEEIVLYASPAYGFLHLPDRLTTGSSLLPHKRNPDGGELLRAGGKAAIGEVATLAATLCGLVSGYSKDLQSDKELLFRAYDRTMALLGLAERHVASLRWDAARMAAACGPELTALWLADRLVLAGLPFRSAHHYVGAAVRLGQEHGLALPDAWAQVSPPEHAGLADDLRALGPAEMLAALRSDGSAAPASTVAQIEALRRALS